MKQIQEWLGHATFNTTADTYSHLDYNSKLASAEKIINALNFGSNKEPEPVADDSVEKFMQEYRLKNITELLDFISNHTENESRKQKKKNYEM